MKKIAGQGLPPGSGRRGGLQQKGSDCYWSASDHCGLNDWDIHFLSSDPLRDQVIQLAGTGVSIRRISACICGPHRTSGTLLSSRNMKHIPCHFWNWKWKLEGTPTDGFLNRFICPPGICSEQERADPKCRTGTMRDMAKRVESFPANVGLSARFGHFVIWPENCMGPADCAH